MARLISVVLCFLAIAFVASANTDINFYFADMLAGVNGGGGNGNSDSNAEADAAYAVEQTINAFFYLNTFASNDQVGNVVYSVYAPLIQPFSADNVVLSTSAPIVNNGTATTYSGVSGLVDYLRAVASARNSSFQQLTNFVYDFSDDLKSVSVNAVFFGLESLESNGQFDTFFGTRTYKLVADHSKEYGYAVTSVDIVRDVTRPSPEWTATFSAAAQQTILGLLSVNDQASNDNAANVNLANYQSLVSPYVDANIVITSVAPGLTGNTSYNGVSGLVQYFADISSARIASQTDLSSFQFSFNADQSAVQVSTKFSGWEQLTSGSYNTFFGTRVYSLVRSASGAWVIVNLNIVRTATFAATRSA